VDLDLRKQLVCGVRNPNERSVAVKETCLCTILGCFQRALIDHFDGMPHVSCILSLIDSSEATLLRQTRYVMSTRIQDQ
jgi:hypothetical protein